MLYVASQFIPIAAIDEEPAYERFVARLARFATVIVFDRRGVGLSDPMRDDPTVDDWAAQLESVLDAAELDSSYVLAHGWGGLPAVTLSATRPQRVRGLVLAMAVGSRGTPISNAVDDVVATARPSGPSTSLDLLRLLSPTTPTTSRSGSGGTVQEGEARVPRWLNNSSRCRCRPMSAP